MRACIQRVSRASVHVDGELVGAIGSGLLVLLGVAAEDSMSDVDYLAEKTATLRIFEDDAGKMNCSLIDCGGQAFVVSQFTLLGDVRKGRRPSFVDAAPPEVANQLYEAFVEALAQRGVAVERGRFRAEMQVELVNEGPVTILIDSRKRF